MNKVQLRADLEKVWCAATSVDPENWTPDNRAWGQCAVTALIVAEFTNAPKIWRQVLEDGSTHYYNSEEMDFSDLNYSGVVDLTRDQFGEYKPNRKLSPRRRSVYQLLSNEGTWKRWLLLRTLLQELWAGAC